MSGKKVSKLHSLRRTSPKGGPFVGICTLCGREGLTLKDMDGECSNIRGLSETEAAIEAIMDKVP